MEESKETNNAVEHTEDNKDKNETVTTELNFELLKQYAWLSSVITGAVVILIQLKVIQFNADFYIPFICFGASILISLFGQEFIVDSLLKGKTIYCVSNKVKIYRHTSMFTLSFGVGMLAANLIKALT
ncbi:MULTISPECIES: hypothetical protein [unclassified Pseudoalteromonas]|uniref:hypothetical protein n=1 Tax=unclassified Pseudoalteromonas TaxID=194690 RepID=UPI003014C200